MSEVKSGKPWPDPPEDLLGLPAKPIGIYQNPMPMPNVKWKDFPKNMPFEEYHQMAGKYGIHHTVNHGKLLYDSAKHGTGEGYIVEIGTYWGHGACYLAFGSKTAGREKVITIDIDKGHMYSLYSNQFFDRPPGQLLRTYMNFLMVGVSDWIIPIRCDSILASEILDVPIRVLHVDGDHYYNPAAWDIIAWEPKLVLGAIVIFHDYNLEGVQKAVDEYIQKNPVFSDVVVVDIMTAYAYKVAA